jgi:FMN phosphatase YigB (HAD superfamily)
MRRGHRFETCHAQPASFPAFIVRAARQKICQKTGHARRHGVAKMAPEVPGVLERLRAGGIRMAIVSDAWPGLDGLYRRLGLSPHERVFVDDAPDLVAAAIELGYGGTAIVRESDPPAVPWISTLEDLVPMTAREPDQPAERRTGTAKPSSPPCRDSSLGQHHSCRAVMEPRGL